MKMSYQIAEKITKDLPGLIQSKVLDLNYGGCGVFAVLFCDHLIRLGFDAKIYALDSPVWSVGIDHESNVDICAYVVSNGLNPVNEGVRINWHYAVRIDEFFFDSEGFGVIDSKNIFEINASEYIVLGEIPLEYLRYLSFFQGYAGWNSVYDRKQNSIVEDIINQHFEAIFETI